MITRAQQERWRTLRGFDQNILTAFDAADALRKAAERVLTYNDYGNKADLRHALARYDAAVEPKA